MNRLKYLLEYVTDLIVVDDKGHYFGLGEIYKPFDFSENYNQIAYDRWLTDLESVAQYQNWDFILEGELSIDKDKVVAIMAEVVPELDYEIDEDLIKIPLDSIGENL